jgi:hypothetical protein
MHVVIVRPRRALLPLLVVVLAGAATIAIPAIRTPILRTTGRALVVDEPVEPSDIIVVAVDSGAAGVLEAADLVRSGTSTRVAVFADPPHRAETELMRRGVPYEDAAARSIRQLQSLGVTTIERIPSSVEGSEDEGRTLPDWCNQHGIRSLVVVSSPDHSRRLRRVLHRQMAGHQTKVMVRFSRYSQFDPDRWWQTRTGTRTEIIEIEKLLLDFAHHPIS